MTIAIPTEFADVWLFAPACHADARGSLQELHNAAQCNALLPDGQSIPPLVQTNYTQSQQHVIRGLHFQTRNPQGKLVTVLRGHIVDVVVNIDSASPQFGQHIVCELSDTLCAEHPQQIWIPAGYAHGFFVLSEGAEVLYHCTQSYEAAAQGGLMWNDADLAVDWRVPAGVQPLLSERDTQWPSLAKLALTR